MKLLCIRHAGAEDRAAVRGVDDEASRMLAKEDRWRARTLGKGLREVVPTVDLIACSPFARARETAEILAELFDAEKPTVIDELSLDAKPTGLVRWLRDREEATIAVVGHDRHLSVLASLLVTGKAERWIPLKRGGACLIEIEETPAAGAGRLLWVLTPAILKRV